MRITPLETRHSAGLGSDTAAAGLSDIHILQVMRNISEAHSNGRTPAGDQMAPSVAAPLIPPAATDRQSLKGDLLEEMNSLQAGDRGGAFKAWHRHALSLVHLNVLTLLEMNGPLSMRRLAESMDVSDASVTGIVDRMEKRSLVERRRGSEDRRVVLVEATDAGRQVFADLAAHRREILSSILDELSDDDMAALLKGMKAIHTARARVLSAAADTTPAPPAGGTSP
jgi:DNA-binding MarR family transcriptional regulator